MKMSIVLVSPDNSTEVKIGEDESVVKSAKRSQW